MPEVDFLYIRLRHYTSKNQSKSAFFEDGKSLWAAVFRGSGHLIQHPVGNKILEGLASLSYSIGISAADFPFVTKHACDRQMDVQNYYNQDRICIMHMQHGMK